MKRKKSFCTLKGRCFSPFRNEIYQSHCSILLWHVRRYNTAYSLQLEFAQATPPSFFPSPFFVIAPSLQGACSFSKVGLWEENCKMCAMFTSSHPVILWLSIEMEWLMIRYIKRAIFLEFDSSLKNINPNVSSKRIIFQFFL